jgi:hypothetical protein
MLVAASLTPVCMLYPLLRTRINGQARILDDLPIFLGNAVAADSHHVLRHLGITHILNATEVSVVGWYWPAGAGIGGHSTGRCK